MKKRILTGVIGSVIVSIWLLLMYTPFFSAILAVVTAIAAYEMLKAFEIKNIVYKIFSIVIAAAIPFWFEYKAKLNIPLFPIITVILIAALIIAVLDFKRLQFRQVASTLITTLFVPSALSCIILFRDVYIAYEPAYTKIDGIFFIIFAFVACWGSDAFALVAGMLFGKHKLAPVISPKKTVEGAIGGIICSTLVNVGVFFLFDYFFTLSANTTILMVALSSPVLSVVSIFGDLAASTIKRQHNIKDFGNILPGHGGIMDRFDSACFVFPALYSVIAIISAING